MKQLSGLDASFLYMENGSSFGHVCSLSTYERPDDPGFDPFEAFRAAVEAALPELEPFRRRLVEVPLGLDRPYWIADPHFDLDFHLRHLAIPPHGDEELVGDQIARIIGRQMDRTKPLWEAYVIEGLPGNEFGILTKIHHATIDGASGVELLGILLETTPRPFPTGPVEDDWRPQTMPTVNELLRRTVINYATQPGKATRLGLRVVRQLAAASRNVELANVLDRVRRSIPVPGTDNHDRPPMLPVKTAPPTPFNKSITPHRRFAMRSVPLEHIKAIKNGLGATVNDVVMAVCAGALRTYLEEHHALPDAPLVGMVPVSIRTGAEEDRWTNRVSGLIADLPTNVEDPIGRVSAMHDTMTAAKQRFDMLPADAISDLAQFAPPALATRAIRMATAARMADRLNPPFNLVISNVPGPRQPMYLGTAKMKHYFPVSTVVDGQGLNITVQSYVDSLDFGLVACRELVPDLWHLADLCVAEVDRLLALSAASEQPTAAPEAPTAAPGQAAKPRRARSAAKANGSKASATTSAAAPKPVPSTRAKSAAKAAGDAAADQPSTARTRRATSSGASHSAR